MFNWRGKTAFWFARSCPKGTNATSGNFHEIPSLQYGRKNTHDFLLSRIWFRADYRDESLDFHFIDNGNCMLQKVKQFHNVPFQFRFAYLYFSLLQ